MALMDPGPDGLHPTIRKVVGAWQLLVALGVGAAGALHLEWEVSNHEQRIKAVEDDNKPVAAELAAIKQQGVDILARLDHLERRQDEEKPK